MSTEPTPEPAPAPAPAPAGPPPAIDSTTEERQMAMLSHIGGILAFWVGPLLMYMLNKDKSAFVADQAKEALNFELNVFVLFVIGLALSPIYIGIPVILAALVGNVVLGIMAGMQANEGKVFRHRHIVRVIK